MKTVDTDNLAKLVGPIVAGLGYELVDLEWKHEAGRWILRAFIDVVESAVKGSVVSHEDCSRVSHAVGAELDVADAIHVPFVLEVSSPGLNRPLKREADFLRFTGKKARIRTRLPLADAAAPESAGRRNFSGKLLGVEAGEIQIDVDGRVFRIPVTDVEKANLQFEF